MANAAKDMVFLIAAGSRHGMGHLMRSVVLAREAGRRGMSFKFLLRGDAAARTVLARELPEAEVAEWSDANIETLSAGVVVFDTRENIDKECGIAARTGAKVVLVDRLSPVSDEVALYVLPVAHADVPAGLKDRSLTGPEYVIISEVFVDQVQRGAQTESSRNTLLITLGGSDPFNVTEKVMDACAGCRDQLNGKKITVVAGPANQRAEAIREKGVRYGMEVVVAPDQKAYCGLLAGSFLVIAGFGIAVYEMAFLGVPALYITHHREDIEDAERLESLGLGCSIGYGPDLSLEDIRSAVEVFFQDPIVSSKTAVSIDGKGAMRIIEKMVGLPVG